MSPEDDFPGKHRKSGSCESITLTRIPAELRDKEADLYLTKWFDYRTMHPLTATAYFAHAYEGAIRGEYARTQDAEKAKSVVVFPGDPIHSRELTALTTARQAFDALGVRYEWALPFVMQRQSDRGFRFMPRPNQLYAEELLLDIRDAWATECAASVQVPRTSKMVIKGEPTMVQAAMEEATLQRIKSGSVEHVRPLVALNMHAQGYVTRAGVERVLGQSAALMLPR